MREFRAPVKIVLFLSSYVPLFFIMALKFGKVPPLLIAGYEIPFMDFPYIDFRIYVSYLSIGILVLCVLFTALLYRMVTVHSGRATTQEPVDKYQKRSELLSMYLLVYVFVFAGLDFTTLLDLGIFLVFFGILGVLQINSEILHVNPMLGLRGYQVYEVTSDEQVLLVISESSLEEKMILPETKTADNPRKKIEVVSLGRTTYLAP